MSVPIVTTLLGAGVGAVIGGTRGAGVGAGVGLALGAILSPRKASAANVLTPQPTQPQPSALGEAALAVSLAEKARWGSNAPDTARVDEYLAGCDPNGAELVALNSDENRINFCAASVGWAEHQTGLGDLPPWRAAAKAIMFDSKAGRRGRWHHVSEVAQGWRPPPGALAIYTRGDPAAFMGHVRRLLRLVDADHYEAIGANEGSRRWSVSVANFDAASLLGFVVDGEPPAVGATLFEQEQNPAALVIEPPVTEQEIASFNGEAPATPISAYRSQERP